MELLGDKGPPVGRGDLAEGHGPERRLQVGRDDLLVVLGGPGLAVRNDGLGAPLRRVRFEHRHGRAFDEGWPALVEPALAARRDIRRRLFRPDAPAAPLLAVADEDPVDAAPRNLLAHCDTQGHYFRRRVRRSGRRSRTTDAPSARAMRVRVGMVGTRSPSSTFWTYTVESRHWAARAACVHPPAST